ncbi:hypothetical protein ACNF40_06185 [Cuniculiplasma sp. SKW4]|uniref:hypothetical protein n=1 Tax=Cuniculiplasma sp. SKW4 TaxID=3400171 RepID=UPI003FD06251
MALRIMRRLLIAFSYDGTKFTGFQRGNGLNSVESEILQCVIKFDLGINMRSASRTDRNVSALRNFMTIDTDRRPEDVLGILNSSINDAHFHSYSFVDDNFNVRHSVSKTYAYILPTHFKIPNDIEDILKKFVGTHDFKNFSKPEGKVTVRTIERIWISEISSFPAIFFKSKGFLWNQIRFIMGYILNDTDYSKDPFENAKRILAPPQNLILIDITYENVALQSFRNGSIARRIDRKSEMARNSYIFYNELNNLIRISNSNCL